MGKTAVTKYILEKVQQKLKGAINLHFLNAFSLKQSKDIYKAMYKEIRAF